jgi:hypothetical protein
MHCYCRPQIWKKFLESAILLVSCSTHRMSPPHEKSPNEPDRAPFPAPRSEIPNVPNAPERSESPGANRNQPLKPNKPKHSLDDKDLLPSVRSPRGVCP